MFVLASTRVRGPCRLSVTCKLPAMENRSDGSSASRCHAVAPCCTSRRFCPRRPASTALARSRGRPVREFLRSVLCRSARRASSPHRLGNGSDALHRNGLRNELIGQRQKLLGRHSLLGKPCMRRRSPGEPPRRASTSRRRRLALPVNDELRVDELRRCHAPPPTACRSDRRICREPAFRIPSRTS